MNKKQLTDGFDLMSLIDRMKDQRSGIHQEIDDFYAANWIPKDIVQLHKPELKKALDDYITTLEAQFVNM